MLFDLAGIKRVANAVTGGHHSMRVTVCSGVVADSDPTYEYRETAAKLRGMVTAVEWAERGLE